MRAELSNSLVDPVELTRALIRCPSVTPEEGGALALLEELLAGLGFACRRLKFSDKDTPDVENLYARIGRAGPNFCFAGHSDVVPVGSEGAWTVEPFAGTLKEGELYGRGASDMKGAIAAFAAISGLATLAVPATTAGGWRKPICAIYWRTCSAIKKKKLITCSG